MGGWTEGKEEGSGAVRQREREKPGRRSESRRGEVAGWERSQVGEHS